MIYHVNIATEEMMNIILNNTAHSMLLKTFYDVMHNHDDKHPAWLESEISISVLIHIRIFIQKRNGVKSINE